MPDGEAPEDVRALAEQRAAARARKDFATADDLRARIADSGWAVTDAPDGGFGLERLDVPDEVPTRVAAADVPSVLDQPPTADASIHWVVEGWPEDVERALASFRAHTGGRTVGYVVADVTGEDPARWGEDVEVLPLEAGTGWGAAMNAALRRSRGRAVVVADASIEATGDVVGPIEAALADPSIGVCGPFGIVTEDLRGFEPSDGPDVDAIEGYLMAFRRETLAATELFDEKFRWYRTADVELSFRIKDAGLRAVVVPLPVDRHEHRMWFATPPAERAKWSKRNFYRFLDRWRDRSDLTVAGSASMHRRGGDGDRGD
jgi:cysteinyl-tRNA synthetase